MNNQSNQLLVVNAQAQTLIAYQGDQCRFSYRVSTGKNGLGERKNSFCTPRGWHQVHSIIGSDKPDNAVFVAREWTGEIYTPALAEQFPDRDWILTRIIRLEGMEPGRNQGGEVDTFERFIYLHGTPDSTPLGKPGSHGCIRLANQDIIELANWLEIGAKVFIE